MNARAVALTALFVGPAAAFVDLAASYYLVYPAQANGSKVWLHVTTVGAAALTAAAIFASRRVLARKSETAEVDRFLAICGVALNAFFLSLIASYAIPKLVLHPTD